jgi:hypothetical protein
MIRLLLLVLFFLGQTMIALSQQSVAHRWTDEILFCIRNDFARPPVHARNLYHLSVVMHDAFAAYKVGSKTVLLDNEWHGFYSPFYGVLIPSDPQEVVDAQEQAISFAAYRLLMWRFQNAPGFAAIYDELFLRMAQLGYDVNVTSVDYINDGPAALGNYIASQMIAFGLQDGSNEQSNFASQYYTDSNPFLYPQLPGNPDMIDPNRFQRLSIPNAVDQAGNPINGTPPHLAPEWGNVKPFSLKQEDSEVLERDGGSYRVYHNPGAPPYIDPAIQTGIEDFYKWNFLMVSVWQSHLDTADNVMWDISPAVNGNIPYSSLPSTMAEYQSFYNYFEGGDYGNGYAVNPITNLPYEPQLVRRGDYARVLAEFWADGLDSETPPGHWFNIYNEISQHPLFEKKWKGQGSVLSDLEYDVQAYLLLGGAMHDAAISAWAIKGYYDYVRPVSAIRYMGDRGQSSDPMLPNFDPAGMPLIPGYVDLVMPGDPLVGDNDEHLHKIKLYTWRGHDFIEDTETDMAGVGWILAENWWPYQRPNFVTPPFAGYISGHSTYSRTAAKVLDFMTGTPYFPGGMSDFEAEVNDFLEFEQGPSQTVVLQWATYYDASDQCSLSRIWGGIHPPIDDVPGRKIGQQVGVDASELVDSLLNIDIPFVVNVELNTDLINIGQIGAQLEITIDFNQDMNTAVNPIVLFPGFASSNDLFTLQLQSWLSPTEFQITYSVQDFEIEEGDVDISIYNAQSLSEVKQNPYLLSNGLIVDTKAPLLVTYEISVPVINSQTSQVCIDLTFDEPCQLTFVPSLEWFGILGIENGLVLNVDNSSWISDNVYSICFDYNNQSILSSGFLSFEITNVYDQAGNIIVATEIVDAIYLDGIEPTISIVASQALLNVSNIGTNAISFMITSSKPMSTVELPLISFSENSVLINQLSINPFLSVWVDEYTCNLVYNLGSEPIGYSNVDLEVTNMVDVSGNLPIVNSFENVFTMDTELPDIETLISNYDFINDAAVAGADFHIDITFSEEMNQLSFTPLVTIKDQGGVSIAGVSYNVFQSSWSSPTIFRARFNVIDLNVEMEDLNVEVSLARDISNNQLLQSTITSPFTLDTRNPQLIDFEISQNILDQTTSMVAITTTFDEPMLPLNVPNFLAVTTQGNLPIFTPILDEGQWIDEFTYSGNYLVNHIYYAGTAGIQVITATDLANNALLDTTIQDNLTIDFLYLTIDDQVGISFSVYPNPLSSGSLLNILADQQNSVIDEVEIVDLMGNLVFIESVGVKSSHFISIKVDNLATGTYLLKVRSSSAESVKKISIIN